MIMSPSDPRFALATDAARLAPRLATALGASFAHVRWDRLSVTRVLADGEGGFRLQMSVPSADGGERQLGAVLPASADAKPDWAADDTPGRAWLPDPGLAVAAFPHDPELRHIGTLLGAGWRLALAGHLGHDTSDPAVVAAAARRPAVLGYRLGKRCVIRLTLAPATGQKGAPASAVVKVVRPRRVVALARSHVAHVTAAPGSAAFALPRVLHVDETLGALVMQDIPGRTLHEQAGTEGLARLYGIAGCALREFHSRPVGDAVPRTSTDEMALLAPWVDLEAGLFPALADQAHRLLGDLAASAGRLADQAEPVLLHRDFYDKQVIAAPGGLTLLDLDTTTPGDAALDLGNFLAHVRLRQLQAPQHARSLAAAGNAFQEAYGPDRALLARTSWWRAAATLRLSALYSLRPRWRALSPRLLEEAETCLRTPERML